MFATWKLKPIDENHLDGPEHVIVERGGSALPIWTNGAVESGATILGKVDGDLTGLDAWNFTEVTRTEAEAFITANFKETELPDGTFTTLAQALSVLE